MDDGLVSQVPLLMLLDEDTGVTVIRGLLKEAQVSPQTLLGHHYFWETHFFFICVGK